MKIIELIAVSDLYQVVNKKGKALFQGNKHLCESYIKLRSQ